MSAQRTPGPWRVLGSTTVIRDIGQAIGEVICEVEDTSSFVQDELRLAANARLIAAAPDLLEACRVLAEGWMQRNHPDSPGVTITDEQMAEAAYDARSAIAKAEHRS
jgi:hypothetical protein